MKFTAYQGYRPSETHWFAEAPAHWEIVRLKSVVRMRSGNAITASDIEDEGSYPVFGGNGLRGYTSRYTHDGHFVLIGRQGALCGNINYAEGRFWASEHAVVAKPIVELDVHWLGELLRTMNLNQYSVAAAQPGLAIDDIQQLKVPVPPRSEQGAIGRFAKTTSDKLDTLISKKQALIERLKEKRTALISRTVTRGLPPDAARAVGLDPNPKLKPSGIEWLGDVPEHWEVKKLRYIGDAIIGLTYDPADVSDQESGVLVLRASNIFEGKLKFEDTVYVQAEIPSLLRTRLDDILICSRSGSRDLIGKNVLIDDRATGVTFGAFMMVFRSPINRYLAWVFNSQLFEFQSSAFLTSTINQLTIKNLYGFEVPLPPPHEQREISRYLAERASHIDRLASIVATGVQRLQEYRTALITAAVTGKIDVRRVAP